MSVRKATRQPAANSKPKTTPAEVQEFPISHAMLRHMYDAMVESRTWATSKGFAPSISEATTVPSALALKADDILAATPNARTLYPISSSKIKVEPLEHTRLAVACQKCLRHDPPRIVLAIFPESVFLQPQSAELLADAQKNLWPLISVVLTDSYYDPRASIPEIDVDGHDAVAVFRVVSESIRRARNRRGPAIIHTHGATKNLKHDPLGDPLARFERYLAGKGLSTKSLHVHHNI